MHNGGELIPAKFLVLVSHFAVCVIMLWNSTETVKSCLLEDYDLATVWNQQTQLIVGLGITVGLIIFEVTVFLSGFTMFDNNSNLIYKIAIACHASASIFLANMIFQNWQCGWFWWIFSFCSILPVFYDLSIVIKAIANKKY